jgi:hypothetical protein
MFAVLIAIEVINVKIILAFLARAEFFAHFFSFLP